MGKYAYTQSQFRFQDGGIPFPGDNLEWGPAGGYGIVAFAGRRGWPICPVDPKAVTAMEAEHKPVAELLNKTSNILVVYFDISVALTSHWRSRKRTLKNTFLLINRVITNDTINVITSEAPTNRSIF